MVRNKILCHLNGARETDISQRNGKTLEPKTSLDTRKRVELTGVVWCSFSMEEPSDEPIRVPWQSCRNLLNLSLVVKTPVKPTDDVACVRQGGPMVLMGLPKHITGCFYRTFSQKGVHARRLNLSYLYYCRSCRNEKEKEESVHFLLHS